jgi:hypothetical protein
LDLGNKHAWHKSVTVSRALNLFGCQHRVSSSQGGPIPASSAIGFGGSVDFSVASGAFTHARLASGLATNDLREEPMWTLTAPAAIGIPVRAA